MPFTMANCTGYSGQMLGGKPHGKGNMTYENGSDYRGEFNEGKRDGHGRCTYAHGVYNGDVYEGEWRNDSREGKGKYTFANGTVYEGYFKDEKMEGKGKMTWINDDVYEGEWKNDMRDGEGKFTFANGNTVYEGKYKNDKMNGWGILRYKTGEVYEVEYKSGVEHDRVKVESKKVVIVGGGSVGLMFAHLLLEYGRRQHVYFNIHIYEARWEKDVKSGQMVWNNDDETEINRRRQLVTIESNVWSLLPPQVQASIFQSDDYSETWVYGPDSPREVGRPRNISVKLVEDKLLWLLQNDTIENLKNEKRQMLPALHNDRVDEKLLYDEILPKGMDYMILADGSKSQTEKSLNEVFTNPLFGERIPFKEDKRMELRDDVLGIYVDLTKNQNDNLLGLSESMALSASQSRFHFNSIPGKFGVLNVWLTHEEKELTFGETSEGQCCARCNESSQCCFTPDQDGGEFICPTHGAVFAPSKNQGEQNNNNNNALWKTITNGLQLYGIELRHVQKFVKFQYGPYGRRLDFHGKIFIDEGKVARAFLLGDAAISVNFHASRGFNAGLKGAINLARMLTTVQDDSDASFMQLNAYMVMLQEREVTIRSELPMDTTKKIRTGEPNPVVSDEGHGTSKTVGDSGGETSEGVSEGETKEGGNDKERLKDRVALVARKTFATDRLPKGMNSPDLDIVNKRIDVADDSFIADLYLSKAWELGEAGGDEVGQEIAEPTGQDGNPNRTCVLM